MSENTKNNTAGEKKEERVDENVRPADTAQVKPDLSVDTDVVDATYGAGFNIMTRWEDDRSPIEKFPVFGSSTTRPRTFSKSMTQEELLKSVLPPTSPEDRAATVNDLLTIPVPTLESVSARKEQNKRIRRESVSFLKMRTKERIAKMQAEKEESGEGSAGTAGAVIEEEFEEET